ncbi:MAG: glycosyltransferase [Candidatus Liptonbacteria bacterium]|nr:glycosyltransferase [Parcubacteria group bacterium]MBI4087366.1 glycosyltransferase [Candidatus Liptonbacteria bacterium]
MRVAHPLRSLLLYLFGSPANTRGWENRILIVNLEAMGDLVMFTSVLKHYKKAFPGKSLYLLIKSGTGMERVFENHFVDRVLAVRYKRFSASPWYGFRLINRLRRIGFAKVVNHDFSAAEIVGKIISVGVGAREVIGYEGQQIEFEKPFDTQQAGNLMILRKKIFPRYTNIIPTVPVDPLRTGYLPHEIDYYKLIYETVSERKEDDYSTDLFYRDSAGPEILNKFGLSKNRYVVLNTNSSVRCKCWPYERFCEVAKYFHKLGFKIILIGSRSETVFTKAFEDVCPVQFVNLSGKTSFEELLSLIANCFMVFTNDTSTVHLAVALKKPSLCVVGGGQFGVAVDYGYADINRWVYKKTDCFFDNWHCCRGLAPNVPSPCVDAVRVTDVMKELAPLVASLEKTTPYPKERFAARFPRERIPAPSRERKLKIIYSGIQSENYDHRRRFSFEYNNFYRTLKNMSGVEVIEYPYDSILEVGKERFNNDLLQLVKREKPDLFFAFMFSDEFYKNTLDEIKKVTKSAAWFADDHWKIYNYSRRYAPHFSFALTTWSLAPLVYAQYGIENVIRSQWACNPKIWKPLQLKKNIDVSFVGQKTAARAAIVEKLRAAGINVFVRGLGWPEGRATPEEMIEVFSSSKINLNLNNPPNIFSPRYMGRLVLRRSVDKLVPSFDVISNFKSWVGMRVPQIKARPFELAGCGAFVISGRADDMGRYYKEGEEVVFYDDADDLIEKIKYYLKHDTERERIAKAAYERTLKEHTYEKRFEEIFKVTGV